MHYCSNLCNQPVNEGSDILYCSILLLMRLTLPLRYRIRGGLLPRLFTLTVLPAVYFLLRCLSLAFYNTKRPAVSRHHIRRSPDFPLHTAAVTGSLFYIPVNRRCFLPHRHSNRPNRPNYPYPYRQKSCPLRSPARFPDSTEFCCSRGST